MKIRSLWIYLTIMILFLLALSSAAKTQLKSFAFTHLDKTYTALLPKCVPTPPGKAILKIKKWHGVDVAHVWYMKGKHPIPEYPIASFWFTEEREVIGLAWHTLGKDGAIKHDTYIYSEGCPKSVNMQEFDAFIYKAAPIPNLERLRVQRYIVGTGG